MMDEVLEVFVSPTTIFVCLAAYVSTYVTRTLVEGTFPQVKTKHFWNEVAVPLGPIVNGGLLGLMAKSFMWPDLVNRTLAARIFYGAICGLFCAFLYGRVRSWLAAKDPRAARSLPPPISSPEETVDAPLGGKSDLP